MPNEPLTISEAARKLIDDIDRRYDVIFADPGTSSKLEEMAQLAINSVVEPLQKENDSLRALVRELADLHLSDHKSNCSVKDPEEPHCDCGYSQHLQQALIHASEHGFTPISGS